MKVCPNCFDDQEIRGFISSSKEIGKCDVCNSEKVSLLDVEEFLDFFQELVENFQKADSGVSLDVIIQENWTFFASNTIASLILNDILPKLSTNISNSEDMVDYIDDIKENFAHWETLKEELKWSRRYLLNIEYLTDELRWDAFFNIQYELKSNIELFRARVHPQSNLQSFKSNNMMCPEPLNTGGGRANPMGIPYLYLCDNPETVLYEVRAAYLDELSIGSFYLKEEFPFVKIVDFTEDTSLFQPTKINETIKAKLLRDVISQDLSKPMRRYDTEIEYIPTQFICEFIKVFTGASGIRFRSSLHPSGKNIVIFDQKIMECKKVVLKKVINMNLNAKEHIV
jgi:hypothetical protein